MGSTKSFLLGAGAAYLLDPRQGKRRRHVLRDRAARMVRRGARLGIKKVRYTGGHVRGLQALARQRVSSPDIRLDDETVVQRIRSEALRDAGVSTRDVEVEVEDGVATLRGSVGSTALADDLVGRVHKVPGVRDVAAIIRVTAGDAAR